MLCCAKSHQSCPTLCDPMDRSPTGTSVHGILQAKILKWIDMPSSNNATIYILKETHLNVKKEKLKC